MKTSQRKVLLASGKYHFDPNTSGLTWQNGAGQCYNTVLFLGVYSFSVVGKGILKNQKDDIEQKSSTYFFHQGFAILSDTVLKSLFIVFIVFLESLDLLLLKKNKTTIHSFDSTTLRQKSLMKFIHPLSILWCSVSIFSELMIPLLLVS